MNRREFFLSAGGLPFVGTRTVSPNRIIDTHTHFYDPSRPQGVPWPSKSDPILYRRTLPERYRKLTKPLGITGTVVIEASPWVADNQWVLDLAKDNPIIVGFVGHLEPGTPDFSDNLARFGKNRLFLGIRVSESLISKGLTQPRFIGDLKRLADRGLEMDALGGPAMLGKLVQLTRKVTNLRVVIDHLPFDPPEQPTAMMASQHALSELGKHPLVYAKVSNVLRRVGNRAPTRLSYYRPALDKLWEIFGPDRLVYGSNWPVSDLIAPYTDVLKVVKEYFDEKGQAAADKFFWINSSAAYRWVERRQARS